MTEGSTFHEVHELVSQLLAVIRSATLYDADHESVTSMIDRLYEQMLAFLRTQGSLEIEVDGEGLSWEGRRLGKPGPNQRDIIFRLYTDGVRVITFLDDLDASALKQLIQTFIIDTSTIDYADQDLATLTWQQDLPGIRFAVVEPFLQFTHASREEEKDSLQEDVAQVKERINRREPIGKPGGIPDPPVGSSGEIENLFPARTVLDLPETEVIRGDALPALIKILLANLEVEDPTMTRRAMENLNRLLHVILQGADLGGINQVLSAVKKRESELFQPFIEHLNSTQVIDSLMAALSRKTAWESSDFVTFILQLEPDAIRATILKTLEWEEGPNLEKGVESLTSYFKFHEDLFLNLVEYFTPEQWKNALRIAETMPAREEILTKALNNPSEEVRLNALNVIESISPSWMHALLWDESETIRMAALERIKRNQMEEIIEDMQVGIMEKDFCRKSQKEKEKWFIVAAMVGREALLPFFMNFFGRKTLTDLARSDDRALYAAKALGVIGSREATDLLHRESRRITNSSQLRKACQEALKNIERKTGGIHDNRGS